MSNTIITESINEITNLIKAKVPIIYTVAADEEQCIKEIWESICKNNEGEQIRNLFVWSSYSGLVEFSDAFFRKPQMASGDYEGTVNNPMNAIKAAHIYSLPKDSKFKGTIFIFRDIHTILSPNVARQLRDIYTSLVANEQKKTIIGIAGMLGHFHGMIKPGIEPSLEKQIAVVRWKLPTREQIEANIRYQVKASKKSEYTNDQYYAISRVLQGLTVLEVDNAIAMSMVEKQTLDIPRLMQEKKQIIMRSDILEFIESDQTMDNLGGLDNFKAYIKNHHNSHTEEAAAFGVDPLSGIVLVGIPGGGKSASAKAIGNEWGLPTLRLDVGKVMGGLVGLSEQRMREVIQLAKAVSPIVLWIDEVEKALSGTQSSSFSDGGTLSRVFGTLLTAMEEEFHGVVVVATANDITKLPPELIRRFSETFYVGLPTHEERVDIWKIHLRLKKRDPEKFDLEKLASETDKFTGSEIKKSLKEAISSCFNDGRREVKTKDIIDAVKATKPIAVVMGSKIKETEEWAKTRARFASSLGEASLKSTGKQKVKSSSGKTMNIADLDLPEMKSKKEPEEEEEKEEESRLSGLDEKN